MQHVPTSVAIVFACHYTSGGANKTGLTVTAKLYRDGALISSGLSATPAGDGLYTYTLSSGNTATAGRYTLIFATSDTSVDVQNLADEALVGAVNTADVVKINSSATAAAAQALLLGTMLTDTVSSFSSLLGCVVLTGSTLPSKGDWIVFTSAAVRGDRLRVVVKTETIGGQHRVYPDRAWAGDPQPGDSISFIPNMEAPRTEETGGGVGAPEGDGLFPISHADLRFVDGVPNYMATLNLKMISVVNDSDNAVVFKSTSGAHAGLYIQGDAHGLYLYCPAGAGGVALEAQSDDPAGMGCQLYGNIALDLFGFTHGLTYSITTPVDLRKVNDISTASIIGTAAAAAILATPSNKLVTDGSGRVTSTNGGGGGVEIEVTEVRAR